MKTRVIKTASNAKAVQVVRYQNNKRLVLKHIGSAHNEAELKDLMLLADEWIKCYAGQLSIFPDEDPNRLLHLNHCSFLGIRYNYFYRQIKRIQAEIGFDVLPSLLQDLCAIRVFEPASKLRSLDLLDQYFSISHSRKTYYRIAPKCIDPLILGQNGFKI